MADVGVNMLQYQGGKTAYLDPNMQIPHYDRKEDAVLHAIFVVWS